MRKKIVEKSRVVFMSAPPSMAIKHKHQILLARSYFNECEHKEAIKKTISLLMALLVTISLLSKTWKDCAWHLPHLSRLPLKCKLKRHSFGDDSLSSLCIFVCRCVYYSKITTTNARVWELTKWKWILSWTAHM